MLLELKRRVKLLDDVSNSLMKHMPPILSNATIDSPYRAAQQAAPWPYQMPWYPDELFALSSHLKASARYVWAVG